MPSDKKDISLSWITTEWAEDREKYFNAVSPPIWQTSNFSFDTVDQFSQAFQDERNQYIYSRGINPTTDILRKKLAALDGAEDCLLFNSGAAAIFAGIFANLKAGDHLVSVKNPYSSARKMFDAILPRFNVSVSYIDGKTIEDWQAATRDNTTLFYLESPNSWTYELQPLAAIAAFAKEKGIVTFIDNTYCTPIYQNVIAMGIDIAMQTATKYIGGHSDTLGGVLCGSAAMMKKIFDTELMTVGSGLQPFNGWLLLRGLRTLPMRLERIRQTTGQLISFLEKHEQVEKIIFPLHPSFEQYELAQQQMTAALGLVTIMLKAKSRAAITAFCEKLDHFLMAVSWGGHESLVIPRIAFIPEDVYSADNESHRHIRLYFGLEDPAYLQADLEQALEHVRKS
ncbi:PLP-dependent aspartate aminotransferase family protein [Niabella insulamsoli]|uniref:trans-sulfuration enzyme family protein n=1 Tax=Niabella insulamsoli TaxID=3144874 RepID=UPI0031FDB1A7